MNKTTTSLLVAALIATALPVHAGILGSDDNSSSIEKGQARTMNKVAKGTVLQVSEAKIEESTTAKSTGVMAGAATGGAIGLGNNGRGGLLGGVLGAVIGGVGGAAVSAFAGSQKAQDLVIQLDDGELTNVTQAVDDKVGAFAEGDAVLVVYKGDSARVIRNKMKAAAADAPAK
ncbi:outer membrane lipoprotein SlyB [Novimethylophilus kurashikiensis]|uniref:Outer membrane lipoprotein SlyB n=1 Tax=Novimethylophilus kurashikiensis TaxID=1825523 RepID=A0A2R5F8K8_9PROT|nr:hypothetical protein [Novimethylophilus kurashikiensis]GBG14556.1 outer membrane lipoprotein SlyB [Novimethylophilus kurashikiensis]